MNLLVTNDDGVEARGIRELVKALAPLGDVYVFVPDSQKSACGHGLTMRAPIVVKPVEIQHAKKAWTLSGTPADCVKLGLQILAREGATADLVYSGINHGANLGTDTLYSGTVSGALEGVINGIPSIAVSVDSHEACYFEEACRMAAQACTIASEKLDGGTMLNINLPNLPREELKGLRITRLGPREYTQWFRTEEDKEGNQVFFYSGQPVVYEDLPEDMDVVAIQDNCVSITPLHIDLTRHDKMEDVKAWDFVL